ncbi:signal peptide peptidase SppA [Methanoplanus sp. FWC-SCC4]|uniref:Signal peptide peptidase SppA n=1 Tax=Methanochimaera problematica TaxID=2609417 RepID=A0AA97FCL8_9EURY|nr:signal peptide peptidase SppA [Methanoplanus sp. FWC-SCC4]WOF16494.1 signal peptide peptidase SppA [Methanoplanus sp. FWC-SCC4]
MSWLNGEIGRIEKKKLRRNGVKWFLLGFLFTVVLLIAISFMPYSNTQGVEVIRVDGTIVTGNFYTGEYTGSEWVGSQLRKAADDPLVDGIVLRVNSPGGSPAAAQEIIEDIEYAKKKKPVVVSMGDVATSAAYHISSHADRIFANPDTMTGSIGTIWTFYDVSKSLDKEGVSVSVVKSGEQKDLGSTFRALTDEEREYVQKIVDESFERFISDVIEQRGIDRKKIEEAQLIRGEDALKLGLVDEMGNLYSAIEYTKNFKKYKSGEIGAVSSNVTAESE